MRTSGSISGPNPVARTGKIANLGMMPVSGHLSVVYSVQGQISSLGRPPTGGAIGRNQTGGNVAAHVSTIFIPGLLLEAGAGYLLLEGVEARILLEGE